jgi:hypothetical protein
MGENTSGLDVPAGRDDLLAIKGIDGPAARALERIGIHRYADLARFTPEGLSEALKKKIGALYSPDTIRAKNWIKQAKMRAQKPEKTAASTPPAVPEASEKARRASEKSWSQLAGFSVFFDRLAGKNGKAEWQARVYHNETDQEKAFNGADRARWLEWMLRSADLEPEAREALFGANRTAAVKVVKPEKARIGITEFELSEKQAIPRNRINVKAGFSVSGTQAKDLLEEGIAYRMEILLRDLERRAPETVAASWSALEPKKEAYLHCYEISMPSVGRYEAHCLVVLLPPAELAAYLIGPTVNIDP